MANYLKEVGNSNADVPTADVADKLPMQAYNAVITKVDAVVLDQYKANPQMPAMIKAPTKIINEVIYKL